MQEKKRCNVLIRGKLQVVAAGVFLLCVVKYEAIITSVRFPFLLTSLAIHAAEPLVEVLLVLHTYSGLPEGDVFVFIARPLRCWKFC